MDDYVPFALAGLREHAAHVLVVVNGALSDAGRVALESVSDEVLVRENSGFDIWAHKDALDHVGARIAEFDEVLLTNDTWFGPVRPYGPVFERMGERSTDFWGMTDHAREVPNPFTGKGVLPYHLQSFWIAVRREMFLSDAWVQYWRDLPEMPSYFDAVLKHETIFTEHFAERGFTHDVAYPSADYPTDHPALFNADLLLRDDCPLLKRRQFFHYPPYLDRHAVIGRRVLRDVEDYGYPMPVLWQNLARNVAPKVLNADAGMMEVLPDVDVSYDPERPYRIAVIAHVPHARDLDELLSSTDDIGQSHTLFVTTTTDEDAATITQRLAEQGTGDRAASEVRVVPARGRDMSAFFVGMRDVLVSGDFDLIVKVHTRRPKNRSANAIRYFRRHQVDNLLGSPGYFANVLALFQREPGLGIVMPPMIHVGYATPGKGWAYYLPRAKEVAAQLGIRVPFDGVSPLAPLGGMWICRPAALAPLTRPDWRVEDFDKPSKRRKADLARVLERLVVYGAGEDGFHARTVMSLEHAGISHVSMEYKLDQLASTTPGYPIEQIQFLHRAGWIGKGGAVAMLRMYLNLNHPALVERVRPVVRPVTSILRRAVGAARGAQKLLIGAVKGARS
ncbi:rhamnan synthesis F family protein [Microbacterium sp. LTA6]|uniref:rhamnan synthesis F family protein n=1 Tax=unclassified Microbacterium TaxID=2609290 RepID=UPI003138C146